MEDEARQLLVGGIDARRPEMAGAAAATSLLELGHEQEGEQEREEEHSDGKEEMGSGLKRNGASPGQLAGGDTGRAEMRALLTGRKIGGTGFPKPVAPVLAGSKTKFCFG